MTRQKKTHTKSTERTPSRRMQQARASVAAEAARILATEGPHNYHAAKRKAAERIGVSERAALPSNFEVEEALRTYQLLYGGEDHRQNLVQLRETAIRAMKILHTFSPRLVGPVLDGTAGAHSRIALHAFSEPPDMLLLDFLEHNRPFRQEQRSIRWHDGSHRLLPLMVFDFEDREIEVTVFNLIGIRQAPPSPIDGKPQRRATIQEVEYLLAESPQRLGFVS